MNHDVILSEIQFVPINPKDGLVGFASFILYQKYYVGSVAVYTRLNGGGYRLVYPAKKVGERSINTFRPIDPIVGREIEDMVSEKVREIYDKECNEIYDRSNPTI